MRKFKFISILLLINISFISAEDLKTKRQQFINNTFNQIIGSTEKEYLSKKAKLTEQRQKIKNLENACDSLPYPFDKGCKRTLKTAISFGDNIGKAFSKAEKQYNKAKKNFDDALKLINQFFDYLENIYLLTKTLGEAVKAIPSSIPQFTVRMTGKWINPNPTLRYNETCFLCAHNSFSSLREGYYPYTQQFWKIEEQLKNGIRGMSIDIWKTHKNDSSKYLQGTNQSKKDYLDNVEVRVSHGEPWDYAALFRVPKTLEYYTQLFTNAMQINIFKESAIQDIISKVDYVNIIQPTFNSTLETIGNFLKENRNKNEVVTIFLENNDIEIDLLENILEKSKIKDMILKPTDWDTKYNFWPTLDWMIKKNKRLVIFNSEKEIGYGSKYTFGHVANVVLNMYGEVKIKEAAIELEGSKKYSNSIRYLLDLDYFITHPINLSDFKVKTFQTLLPTITKFIQESKDLNDYTMINGKNLENLLNYVFNNGLEGKYKNRYPNFIFIDFVNTGYAMSLVNDINKKSSENPNRAETIFKPLINLQKNQFLGLGDYEGLLLNYNPTYKTATVNYSSSLDLEAIITKGKKPLNAIGVRYDEGKKQYSHLTQIISFKGLGEYKNKIIIYDSSTETAKIKGTNIAAFEAELVKDKKTTGIVAQAEITISKHCRDIPTRTTEKKKFYLVKVFRFEGLGKYKKQTLIYYPTTKEIVEKEKGKLLFEGKMVKGNPPANALGQKTINNEKYYLRKVFVYNGIEDYKGKKIIYNPETKKAFIEGQTPFDANVVKNKKPEIAIGQKTIEKKNYYLINLFEGIGDYKGKLLAYTPKNKNVSTLKTKQKLTFKLDLVTPEKSNKKDVYAEYEPKAPIGKTILEDGKTYFLVNLEKEYPNEIIFEKSSKEYPSKILIFDPKEKKAFTEYNDKNKFPAKIKKVVSRIGGGRPPRKFLTTKVNKKTREVSYLVKK